MLRFIIITALLSLSLLFNSSPALAFTDTAELNAAQRAAVEALSRCWGRKISILGLRAPEQTVLRIIEESIPKMNSTDRIEKTIMAFLEQQPPAQRAANLRAEAERLERQALGSNGHAGASEPATIDGEG